MCNAKINFEWLALLQVLTYMVIEFYLRLRKNKNMDKQQTKETIQI